MGLRADRVLSDLGPGPVAFDTAAFIYYIEEHPRFLPLVEPLFQEVAAGRREMITSAITLLEVLVVPYRSRNHALAEQYETLLTRSRGVRLVDISRDHLRVAAQLRAATGIRAPDAIQLATAMLAGCSAFITNDRDLPSISGLRIVQLSMFV